MGENLIWSALPPRRKYSKVSEEVKDGLKKWIINHPSVTESPLMNDTLIIKDKEKKKIRVPKLLLSISVRELHNQMIRPVHDGGFAGSRDGNGDVIISDTALRYFLPSNLRPMADRYKQLCGCETCLVPQRMQQTLNAWRLRRIKYLQLNGDTERARKYEEVVHQDGKHLHPTSKSAMLTMVCPEVTGCDVPHWNCVLRRCKKCPQYVIPEEENDCSPEGPKINFHIYKYFNKCSKHGVLPNGEEICDKCSVLIVQSKRLVKCQEEKSSHLCLKLLEYFIRSIINLCWIS